MFDCEAGFFQYRKKHGQQQAVELVADINHYTRLYLPDERSKKKDTQADLLWKNCLFDHNEHFIELSNMGEEDRSLALMLSALFVALLCLSVFAAIFLTAHFGFDAAYLLFLSSFAGFSLWLNYMLWPLQYAPNYFTHLRARYRFNRTTRKVYVLRPARYGGNVVLDWDRVQAHVNWCAPREMTYDDLRDPVAREARQNNGGGQFGMRGLVLYWPPLDAEDKSRKGEEVLWVGPKLAGENLWQYIRTFMEEGFDKVPAPNEYEWLRKGFSTPSQHLEEVQMRSFRVHDLLTGRKEPSVSTQVGFLSSVLWAPLHCLSERLCTWPTFPEEWNSDCGQKRRESGIGPEEPLRWSCEARK